MNPIEFLNVANRLHDSPDEAERRTSISRSYYAAYHILFQALSVKNVRFGGTADDHGRLARYLADSGDSRAQNISAHLNTLRYSRVDADYRMNKPIERMHSQLSYLLADKAITAFNTISSPDIQTIVNAIKSLPFDA